jgi:hypothetical protein
MLYNYVMCDNIASFENNYWQRVIWVAIPLIVFTHDFAGQRFIIGRVLISLLNVFTLDIARQ